jgi:hypothetical protein
MKTAKDTTRELPNLPKSRGGWREGAGRKKGNWETKLMRVDTRLIEITEILKEKLRSGAIDEKTIETLTELVA